MRCPLLLRRPRTALRLVPAPRAWHVMKWAWGCRLPARRRRVLGRAGRLWGYRAMQSGARALRSRTKRSARGLGLGTGLDRTIAVATRLSGAWARYSQGSLSSPPCMCACWPWLGRYACVLAPLASETADAPSIPAPAETAEGTAGEYCATCRMGVAAGRSRTTGLPHRVCPGQPPTGRVAHPYRLAFSCGFSAKRPGG